MIVRVPSADYRRAVYVYILNIHHYYFANRQICGGRGSLHSAGELESDQWSERGAGGASSVFWLLWSVLCDACCEMNVSSVHIQRSFMCECPMFPCKVRGRRDRSTVARSTRRPYVPFTVRNTILVILSASSKYKMQ